MNEFKKYFTNGVDGLLDDVVKAVVKPIEETLEYAEFLAVILLAVGFRRLKMLLLPSDEVSEEEKIVPALSVEAISSMTDTEIVAAFGQLDALARAKFIIAMRKVDGSNGQRFNALLKQMKIGEQTTREQNTAAIARRAQEEADRARKAADEAEAKRVRRDDEALAFIAQAPAGRFAVVSDLDAAIDTEDGSAFDWVNRKEVHVGDAMVLGLCLITDKRTAERLAEKLRRPKDKNRPLAYSIAATRDFLVQRAKENEAAAARKAEEEREAKARKSAECGDFTAMVQSAFAGASTIQDKELVRNRLKVECGGESWKFDIVRKEAEATEHRIFVAFRQKLRERFPHSSTFAELDAFIKEMEEFIERSSDESWTDNVMKGAERYINIIRRHRNWLEDNPAGVRKPEPQADVIDFGKWESSAGRERPKFGPGSGLGKTTRAPLTADQELARYGRQLLTSNWGRFCNLIPKSAKERGVKAVGDLTDEELIEVGQAHRKPQKGDKAAKKQGGGKKS